jgi:hypothetical protein
MADTPPNPGLDAVTDALRAAQARGVLPTSLGTAELRDLGAEVLARSVFTARGTNAVFADELKRLVDQLAAGDLSEGQVRTALWETMELLGYDAERGGFLGEELEPALRGTLQDLKSFRRRDLIVRTQRDLMQGAGQQMRAMQPDSLSVFPAFELVRMGSVDVERDWPSRWVIAGFPSPGEKYSKTAYKRLGEPTGMIGLIGDPRWGELGGYGNFQDALGVDHAPFYFNSEIVQRLVPMARVLEDGITGPNGETPAEWLASGPVTLAGKVPLPPPKISLRGVDPAIIERFKATTGAEAGARPGVFDYSALLARDLKTADEAYQKGAPTR